MATAAALSQEMNGAEAGHLLPAPQTIPRANISGLRKAAVLLIAIGDELAKGLLQSFSENDVQRLTEEIANIKEISPGLILQVMNEFHELLETQQYMLRGGMEYAKKLLVEAFGRQRAEDLMAQVRRAEEATHSDLAMLQNMDPQQLSKFLEGEHPQTVALVLAHLDPKRASVVLMNLEEPQRVAAVYRLAEMRQFSPEMAQKVAVILHQRSESGGTGGRRAYSGFKAVADLMNRLDQQSSKTILEEIEKKEPTIAIGIRNLMFTFDDLLTVPSQSMREIVNQVDKRMLGLALKGAKEDLRAHMFKAMSSRAVEMLVEDMEVMGPVRMREVAAAQQEMLQLARKLETEGKIILKVESENDFAI
jgi:flagellar motor switch protein FliG